MLPIIIAIVALVLGYLVLIKPSQHFKNLNVEYAKPVPLFGNMAKFVLRTDTLHNIVVKLYEQHMGRFFGIFFFSKPILVIKDVSIIKQIGIKDFDYFTDHMSFIDPDIDPLLGKHLFALKGNKWREMRATLSPAFTSSKMKAMFVLISECARQLTEHYGAQAGVEPLHLELKDTFTRLANDVIATTAFGISCNSHQERDNEFYLMGKEVNDNTSIVKTIKAVGYGTCKPLMHALKITFLGSRVNNYFRNIITSNIASREKEGIVRPDMIHLLMEARKGKLKNEVQKGKRDEDAGFATVDEFDMGADVKKAMLELTDDDITAQALLFFLAGFDTISTAMCNMGYELAQHPEIQERLQEEIDEALEASGGKVTYEMVMKLKYLDMVLSEALRKWPALVVTDRVCNATYTIPPEKEGEQSVTLNKGDVVWFPCYPIHRDPQYYPDPERFDPERFSDDNKQNINPMAYLPFGVGPRNCIGSRYALMEVKVTFVTLLSKFTLVLTDKSQVPIQFKPGLFNLTAERGYWVGLKKRIKGLVCTSS